MASSKTDGANPTQSVTDATTPAASDNLAHPTSVLFICNHNVIRSPMAEAITRARFGNRIYTASAGIAAGTPDPFVDAVLKEIDIDIHDREPQSLADLDDGYFDLIITLSPQAHLEAQQRAHVDAMDVEYWFAADPTEQTGKREQRLSAYRDVRDSLVKRITERFAAVDPLDSAGDTKA